MQQQNFKACKYADLQHFDSVCIQSMYKSFFFEQMLEEKQGKKEPVAYTKQLLLKGLW